MFDTKKAKVPGIVQLKVLTLLTSTIQCVAPPSGHRQTQGQVAPDDLPDVGWRRLLNKKMHNRGVGEGVGVPGRGRVGGLGLGALQRPPGRRTASHRQRQQGAEFSLTVAPETRAVPPPNSGAEGGVPPSVFRQRLLLPGQRSPRRAFWCLALVFRPGGTSVNFVCHKQPSVNMFTGGYDSSVRYTGRFGTNHHMLTCRSGAASLPHSYVAYLVELFL